MSLSSNRSELSGGSRPDVQDLSTDVRNKLQKEAYMKVLFLNDEFLFSKLGEYGVFPDDENKELLKKAFSSEIRKLAQDPNVKLLDFESVFDQKSRDIIKELFPSVDILKDITSLLSQAGFPTLPPEKKEKIQFALSQSLTFLETRSRLDHTSLRSTILDFLKTQKKAFLAFE